MRSLLSQTAKANMPLRRVSASQLHCVIAASKTSASLSVRNCVSERAELFSQFAIVVDFAVEGENVAAVSRQHRFVSARARVDNR